MKNDTAIVIVTYNNPNLIERQIKLIRKYCKENPDIIIVDNSTNKEAIDVINYWSNIYECQYFKTWASSMNGSDSHAFAANLGYTKFKDEYDYFLFLDHDNIPIKEFSIKEMLKDKIMVGVGQNKEGIEYFWAGCVMWNNKEIDKSLINFSCNHELKLDTGGELRLVIQKYGPDKYAFLIEEYVQNPNFNKSMYNFYVLINYGMFFHCLNFSGWNESEANEERINSLLNILDDKTK